MNKVRLGDVAEVITKGTTPTSIGYSFQDCGINFIKIESIAENGNFLEDKFAHISVECNESLKRSQLRCNDLLFSIAGAIGRVAIVDDSILPANTNQALAIIRIPEGIINYNFLYYFLKSEAVIKQYSRKKQGVAQINLSLKDISDLIIYVPSLFQQNKIVKAISFLDELIKKANHQKEKLDELIKSRFVEMFGDMVLNPKGFDQKPLGELCDVRDGTHDSPKYYNVGYPLITSKNVTNGELDFSECSLICRDDYDSISKRSKVDYGDILMPMIGTVGNPVIVNTYKEFAIKNVALIKFYSDSRLINVFVKELLKSDYFDIMVVSKIRGGTQKFIALRDIRKLRVCVPPIELQNQFAELVAQVEKQKETVKKSLDKLETLKKSLMQEYFG